MCARVPLVMQSGGAPYFQKKAALLEKEIASAEQEAGGNQEELELSFKRVRVSWHALQLSKSHLQLAWVAHVHGGAQTAIVGGCWQLQRCLQGQGLWKLPCKRLSSRCFCDRCSVRQIVCGTGNS